MRGLLALLAILGSVAAQNLSLAAAYKQPTESTCKASTVTVTQNGGYPAYPITVTETRTVTRNGYPVTVTSVKTETKWKTDTRWYTRIVTATYSATFTYFNTTTKVRSLLMYSTLAMLTRTD